MNGISCLKGEIHNVTSFLRPSRNGGSFFTSQTEDEHQRQRLLSGLHELHGSLGSKKDLDELDTCTYLTPFLDVLTSGMKDNELMLTTLRSIEKFLLYHHITLDSPRVGSALHSITISILLLARSGDLDEVILVKIMQVLCELIRSQAGLANISDDDVCEIVQLCFRIRVTEKASYLLVKYSENTLIHMVMLMFSILQTRLAQEIQAPQMIAKKSSEIFVEDATYIPFGIPALVRVLKVLATIISEVGISTAPTRQFGLRLLNTALEAAGENICLDNSLVRIIQDDICKAILLNSQTEDFSTLALTLRIVFDLFNTCKKHLKVQLEVFFTSIHLKIVESEYTSRQQKELAMESLVELTLEPELIVGLYTNYDCELGCTALFETLFKFLVAQATPTSYEEITELNLIASEGILTMVESLARRFCSVSFHEEEDDVDGVDSKELMKRRAKKKKLKLAADKFNEKGAKGLQYIGEVLEMPITAKNVARFLRETAGLDKSKVGEFLSKNRELSKQSLIEYVNTFDFTGLTIDEAMRLFLESFCLHGEAQAISRVMETFSGKVFEQSPGPMLDADACFITCFSIMQLNTDAHREQIKSKMTMPQYKKQLRNLNKGTMFPEEWLESIYTAITRNEIKVQGEGVPRDILCAETQDIRTSEWQRLVQKSSKVGAFTTVVNHQIGRDMFQIIWKDTLEILGSHLKFFDVPKVVERLTQGFSSFAQICFLYEEVGPFNELISTISSALVGTLNEYPLRHQVHPIVRFGADGRMRILLQFYFEMFKTYGRQLALGCWGSCFKLILRMRDLDLLQNDLELDDFRGSKGEKIPSIRDNLRRQMPKSPGFMQSIFGGIFLDAEEESDELLYIDQNLAAQYEEVATQALSEIDFDKLIHGCREYSDDVIDSLLQSLMNTSHDVLGGKLVLEDLELANAWLLEQLSVILGQNRTRAALLWPKVQRFLLNLLQNQLQPSLTAERLVVALFRNSFLLDDNSSTSILEPLMKLEPDIFRFLSARIMAGLQLTLSAWTTRGQEQNWKPIFDLLLHFARQPENLHARGNLIVEDIFACIQTITTHHICYDNFNLVLSTLERFLSPKSPLASSKYDRVLDCVLKLNAELIKEDEDHVWPNNDSRVECWFSLIKMLCKCVWHPSQGVRKYAANCLQKLLLTAHGSTADFATAEVWLQCFEGHLIPLLERVSTRDDLEDLRVRVSGLLFYSLLHKLTNFDQANNATKAISDLPGFHEFWLRVLGASMKFMTTHAADHMLWVHCQEKIKNILVVCKMCGALDHASEISGVDFWEETWAVLRKYSPVFTELMQSMVVDLTGGAEAEYSNLPIVGETPHSTPLSSPPHDLHTSPGEPSPPPAYKSPIPSGYGEETVEFL